VLGQDGYGYHVPLHLAQAEEGALDAAHDVTNYHAVYLGHQEEVRVGPVEADEEATAVVLGQACPVDEYHPI